MFFDFQSSVQIPNVTVYPDYVFPSPPRQPEQIKETFVLKGTTTGTNPQATGTPDAFPDNF